MTDFKNGLKKAVFGESPRITQITRKKTKLAMKKRI
jgi:hypothetical protein